MGLMENKVEPIEIARRTAELYLNGYEYNTALKKAGEEYMNLIQDKENKRKVE